MKRVSVEELAQWMELQSKGESIYRIAKTFGRSYRVVKMALLRVDKTRDIPKEATTPTTAPVDTPPTTTAPVETLTETADDCTKCTPGEVCEAGPDTPKESK